MKSLIFILTLFVISKKVSGEHVFDCRRYSVSCYSDRECKDDGQCDCGNDEDEIQGFDCRYNITSDLSEDCSPACERERQCLSVEDETFCHCEQEYYGIDCQEKRLSHTCAHDSITITIKPSVGKGEFRGKIYVPDQERDPNCIFDLVDDVFTKKILFTDCGEALNETIEGQTRMTFQATIQYSPIILTEHDETHPFECIIPPSGSAIGFDSNIVEEDKGKLETKNIEKEALVENLVPIKVTVENEAREVLTPEAVVDLGALLFFIYELEGGELYNSFKLEDLTVFNGLEEDDEFYQDVPFVRDGCVTKEAESVVSEMEGSNTDKITISMNAFKFFYGAEIQMKNKVKLCKDLYNCNATDCEAVATSVGGAGLGRKKRDLEAMEVRESQLDGEEYREFDTRLYVHWPGLDHQTHQNERNIYHRRPNQAVMVGRDQVVAPSRYCAKSVVLLIIIIIMAVLLLLVTGCCLFYCISSHHHKQTRRAEKTKGVDNPNLQA